MQWLAHSILKVFTIQFKGRKERKRANDIKSQQKVRWTSAQLITRRAISFSQHFANQRKRRIPSQCTRLPTSGSRTTSFLSLSLRTAIEFESVFFLLSFCCCCCFCSKSANSLLACKSNSLNKIYELLRFCRLRKWESKVRAIHKKNEASDDETRRKRVEQKIEF